jgi:formate-dependent nitrite reductase cytochrome c552 subunit
MSSRFWLFSAGTLLALTFVASHAASEDACVKCHSDPKLLVKNKKLHDYFQRWEVSVHHEAGVTCSDCHGGNPAARTKQAAHGSRSSEAGSATSAINFQNVPSTCATCHEDITKQYESSKHYAHLTAAKGEHVGPNCVTCHGSVNASAVGVATVEDVCGQCHGADNHPGAPAAAKEALRNLRNIDRFTRYISLRGDPQATRAMLEKVAADRRKLAQTWHTFSLRDIHARTQALLDTVRAERQKARARPRRKKPSPQ